MSNTDFENTKPETVILVTVTLTLLRSPERFTPIPIFKPNLVFTLAWPVKYEMVPYNVFHSDVAQYKNKLAGKKTHIFLRLVTQLVINHRLIHKA